MVKINFKNLDHFEKRIGYVAARKFKRDLSNYINAANNAFRKIAGIGINEINVFVYFPEDYPETQAMRSGELAGYARELNLIKIPYSEWGAKEILRLFHEVGHAVFKNEISWLTGGMGKQFFASSLEEQRKIYSAPEYICEGTIQLLAIKAIGSAIKDGKIQLKLRDFVNEYMKYKDEAIVAYLLAKGVGWEIFLKAVRAGNFALISENFCKKYKISKEEFFKILDEGPQEAISKLSHILKVEAKVENLYKIAIR